MMKRNRFLRALRRTILLSGLILILTGSVSAFDVSADSNLLMLVSKAHPISEDYVPTQITIHDINAVSNGRTLRKEAFDAFTLMYRDMTVAGITRCNIVSGYRSYATQLDIVNSKVDARVAAGASRKNAYNQVIMSTAPAGCSEHQLGLAIDLSTGTDTSQSFASSAAGLWMEENCWKYGFIRRYQGEKSALTGIVNEAWHYRYLGVPHAQIMHENNWCFEEYVDYLHKNGSYTILIDSVTYHVYWTQDTQAEFEGIIDISSDNLGGWIITTSSAADPLYEVKGHWSESSFRALLERGITFHKVIAPASAITRSEFSALLGLTYPGDVDTYLTREDAAALLERLLPNKDLTYLKFSDLDKISIRAFQSVQVAVANGIFTHTEGAAFRPTDHMTWGEAAATVLRYLERMDAHTGTNP